MTKITVKLIGSGTPDDPYRVNLPSYSMFGEPDYAAKTCVVEVPDDELDESKKRPDRQKLREKYRGQSKWDRADVADDV
jgi:hypothetical protein